MSSRPGRHNTGPADADRLRALGYRPVQNSENFAADVLQQPLDAIGKKYQGGSFARLDDTPGDQRPRDG